MLANSRHGTAGAPSGLPSSMSCLCRNTLFFVSGRGFRAQNASCGGAAAEGGIRAQMDYKQLGHVPPLQLESNLNFQEKVVRPCMSRAHLLQRSLGHDNHNHLGRANAVEKPTLPIGARHQTVPVQIGVQVRAVQVQGQLLRKLLVRSDPIADKQRMGLLLVLLANPLRVDWREIVDDA